MTTERPPGTMPTGPYREPDKMDIYMNFHKNGNPVWMFCKPKASKSSQDGGSADGCHGTRFFGSMKKTMSASSINEERLQQQQQQQQQQQRLQLQLLQQQQQQQQQQQRAMGGNGPDPEEGRGDRGTGKAQRKEEEEEEEKKALIGEHNQQHDTRTHSHSNAHAHAHGKSAHADMVKSVEDLSMTHRDPINLSSYVRIGFEEVFAEPDGQQSFDAIWTTSFIVYTQAKTWCYRLLSAILSIPLALLWGIHFAILTFCHIWFVMPCGRAWLVLLHWVGKFWNVCIRTLCDPLGDSCSRFLGNVKVQMNPTHHV